MNKFTIILITVSPLLFILTVCAISILTTPKSSKKKFNEPDIHP